MATKGKKSKDSKATKSNEKQLGGVTGKGFMPGQSGNPKGMKPLTDAEKLIRRENRKMVKEYRERYEDALETVAPAVIKAAEKGQSWAVQEIHKVVGAYKNDGGNKTAILINFGKDRDEYA